MAGTIKHEWNGTILTITSDSGTSSADLRGNTGATGARGARGLTGRTGGGALIEDGVIRDDTTWSSAGIMDRFAEAFSTSGNPVVCNNALANVPFNIITEFEPKQEGSGNPYPAGTGKNKLPYPTVKSQTVNGIAYTFNADGTITANGTLADTTKTASITLHTAFTVKAGSWKFICEGSKSITNFYPVLYQKGSPNVVVANARPNTYATFTTETDLENCYVFLACLNGYAPQNETLKIMLVSASETNLTYEPYSNIRPIVGYNSINITRNGKNLMPEWEQGSISQNGTDADADKVIRSGWAAVVPNTVYTLTRTGTVGAFAVRCYDENKNYLGVGGVGTTTIGNYTNKDTNPLNTSRNEAVIKVLEGCYYLRFIDYANDLTNKYQFEVGETATAYEPYKGEIFTLSLGNTYYGGSLDWNTGELIVDKYGVVLNGSENWAKAGDGTASNAYRFYLWESQYIPYLQPCVNDYKPHETLICSHYTTLAYMDIPKGKTGIGVNPTVPTPVLGIYNPLFANYTVDKFKAELAKEPITITYGLAEPQIIKLEPQIIKALSGINTLYTNADNLLLVGRIDTMKTIQELLARVSALEAKVGE